MAAWCFTPWCSHWELGWQFKVCLWVGSFCVFGAPDTQQECLWSSWRGHSTAAWVAWQGASSWALLLWQMEKGALQRKAFWDSKLGRKEQIAKAEEKNPLISTDISAKHPVFHLEGSLATVFLRFVWMRSTDMFGSYWSTCPLVVFHLITFADLKDNAMHFSDFH